MVKATGLLAVFLAGSSAASSFEEQQNAAKEAYQYSVLASKTYGNLPNVGIWEVAYDLQGGIQEYSYDRGTGFSAHVYRNQNDGEIVVAFAGTNPRSIKDVATDISQGALGSTPEQYRQAKKYVEAVEGSCRCEVTLTGHSLGGGLAQYAAWSLGRKAYAFNPVGLNLKEVQEVRGCFGKGGCRGDDSRINNLIVEGDLAKKLRRLTGTELGGKQVVFNFPRGNLLEAHDMGLFRKDLQKMLKQARKNKNDKGKTAKKPQGKSPGKQSSGIESQPGDAKENLQGATPVQVPIRQESKSEIKSPSISRRQFNPEQCVECSGYPPAVRAFCIDECRQKMEKAKK